MSGWSKKQMARRAAAEIAPGSVVNLGIGLPTLVADVLPVDADVWLQSENGLLGMGPFPIEGQQDAQLINAGKQTVTMVNGASIFDSATSFAMIRGGHVDLAIMGAMQVAQNGDLANWMVPGGRTTGIGGAMDLAAGARRLLIVMRHNAKDNSPKLVARCTFPLTACGAVTRIITELGVFEPAGDRFKVFELAPGVTAEQAQEQSGAQLDLIQLQPA